MITTMTSSRTTPHRANQADQNAVKLPAGAAAASVRLARNSRWLAGTLVMGCLLLGGCASIKPPAPAMYDLGPLPSSVTATMEDRPGAGSGSALGSATGAAALTDTGKPRLPALALAEAAAPNWMDTPAMFYRLDYANAMQPLPYAGSRWNMPPADLFAQRLKVRLGQAGSSVISSSDGAIDVPVLRLEADEFMQRFSSASQSEGVVVLRLAVIKDRLLVAQKNFSARAPAPTADAAGGVRALADASDKVIDDIILWLAGLPLKK